MSNVERSPTYHDKEPILDQCGIIAAYSKAETQFFVRGLAGLYKEQTRGQTGAGVAVINEENGAAIFQDEGMIENAFSTDTVVDWSRRSAKSWALQTRYGTHGSNEYQNIQPIIRRKDNEGGYFSVVHNGNFLKSDRNGDVSDTVMFANELAQLEGDWDEKILHMQNNNLGAWSLVVNKGDAMYAMRGPYGIRPMVHGEYIDRQTGQIVHVVASETAAMEAMGVTEFTEVMPGQVVKFDDEGITILQEQNNSVEPAQCSFENAYIADEETVIHREREENRQINNEPKAIDFREKTAELLAKREKQDFTENTVAIGVPGTGIAGGKVFAKFAEIPYIQAIVDNNNGERTFIMPEIEDISPKLAKHFNFKESFLRGMKVVLVDDSVVRGNVTKNLIRILKEVYGVEEVHVRVLFPPVDKPCFLGIATKEEDELLAGRNKGNIEEMRKEIGADSLDYVTDEEIYEATGSRNVCLGCTVGHHPPKELSKVIYQS